MRALEIILEIFFCSFSYFLCEASGRYAWGRPDGDPDCPDDIYGVRTIQLIRSDGYSSCSDDRVFASSTWHYVLTLLKFRPDGEPCRVKPLSPRAAAHFLASFCVFLLSCVFF